MKCFFDVSPSPVFTIVPSILSKNVVPISSLHSSHFSAILKKACEDL